MAVKIPSNGLKFIIKNEEHNAKLQKAFFHYGFKWATRGDNYLHHIGAKCLYLDGDKIQYSKSLIVRYDTAKEMTLNQFINFMEKIKESYTIFGEKIK